MKITILIKATLSLTLFLLLATISFAASGHADERESILKACEVLFGKPVDVKENLFEINSLYVLQAKFDPNGNIRELAFFPKYVLQESHPEWTEPKARAYLAKLEYENLLARLDKVKPKGALVMSGAGSAITNSTEYFWDQYENAFLHRGEYPDGVRFASLYFFHNVEGKISRKCQTGFRRLGEHYYNVVAGECLYLVRKETFARLRVNRKARFLAAGPTRGGGCGSYGECNH